MLTLFWPPMGYQTPGGRELHPTVRGFPQLDDLKSNCTTQNLNFPPVQSEPFKPRHLLVVFFTKVFICDFIPGSSTDWTLLFHPRPHSLVPVTSLAFSSPLSFSPPPILGMITGFFFLVYGEPVPFLIRIGLTNDFPLGAGISFLLSRSYFPSLVGLFDSVL